MVVSAAFAVVSVAVNLYGGVITEQKRAELQLEVGWVGRPGRRQLGGAGRRGGGGPAGRQGSAGRACVALGSEFKGAQYERGGQRARSGGPGNAYLVVHAEAVPCRSNPCGDHLLLLHALMLCALRPALPWTHHCATACAPCCSWSGTSCFRSSSRRCKA